MQTDELRAGLAQSRAALLSALEGLTERDFAASTGGATVLGLLSALAPAEREAVQRAREAAGAARRPSPQRAERSRPLAPQIVHDMAGARYETMLLLDLLEASTDDEKPSAADHVRSLLAGVAERERATAERIAARERE